MSKHLDELMRHIEDCEQSKMRHFDYADICEKRKRTLSIINFIALGLVLAWVLSTQFKSIIPNSYWLYEVFPVTIALLLAGLNAFEAKAGFDRIYEVHLTAANKYHKLWRDCINWESDFNDPENTEFGGYVKNIRDRLDQINSDSPHLSIFQQKEIIKFRDKHGWKPRNKYKSDEK